MVNQHHHRPYHQQAFNKCGEQQLQQSTSFCGGIKKTRTDVTRFLFIFSLVLCSLLFGHCLLINPSSSSALTSSSHEVPEQEGKVSSATPRSGGDSYDRVPCSSVPDNSICCDRTSSERADVCVLRGDVRTRSRASAMFLYSAASTSSSSPAAPAPFVGKKQSNGSISPASSMALVVEKIRPYTRKWETNVMATIDELDLVSLAEPASDTHRCDVVHDVPAVVFSTGGYTGNVYHEFNDGIIPLYVSSGHLHRRVVFVVLEYHSWWVTKYGDVLSRLSDYPVVEFSRDRRTHCFPEATVGLRIHGELAVDTALMQGNETILDFRQLLDDAYRPRIKLLEQVEEERAMTDGKPPKLVVISRKGSRAIENERELVLLCEKIGFQVEVLRPRRSMELAKLYRALNSSDAMVGVHGAAMTHLLFMRPGSVFIQIVPLGTDWAAQAYYGDPATKMGLMYLPYKILPRESSLYRQYEKDDPVLREPEKVTSQGWEVTKKVYLASQNVRLDLNRFTKVLARAYQHVVPGVDPNWKESWLPQHRRQRRRRARRSQGAWR